jgi:hypothetical protein|tara:strand:+ start:252 stop:452 length:201 start_codon:yes stop_codon:yes gene_type:complete
MTALEQRIQLKNSIKAYPKNCYKTISVYPEILQQFKMAKIRYMSGKNIVVLKDTEFLENILMEMSQ